MCQGQARRRRSAFLHPLSVRAADFDGVTVKILGAVRATEPDARPLAARQFFGGGEG